MDLSIIIVNYNVTDFLRNCLSSIQKFIININYEVIVIDNQSSDVSWKNLIPEFPQFKFIENEKNEGFAKANNKAVKFASGNYILLLNPDTEIEGDYMMELLNFANSKENFGCLGVRMHNASGEFLPESKRSVPGMANSFEKLFTNFKNNYSKSYYQNNINEFDVAEVEIITGAFFLCKREIYNKTEGLDETYFMYGEDIDLCYTLLLNGYKNYYYGKVSILHHKGESTVKDIVYLERFYGAMQIFINKYYKKRPIKYFIISFGLKIKHFIERIKLKNE